MNTSQAAYVKMTDQAARILWAFATSDDYQLARYDSTPYRSAETVFETCYRLAYPDDPNIVVRRVRDLLAELGPDDGYNGQPGFGIASYRLGALDEWKRDIAEIEYLLTPFSTL